MPVNFVKLTDLIDVFREIIEFATNVIATTAIMLSFYLEFVTEYHYYEMGNYFNPSLQIF